jgi:hypothetical protein
VQRQAEARAPRRRGEGVGLCAPGHDLRVAVGGDEQHRRVDQLDDRELEQEQRRGIRGVDVVEHEQERLVGGGAADKRRRRVEEAEARVLRVVGLPLAGVLQERRQLAGRRMGLAHEGPQRLEPRPVGRRASRLPAAAPEDAGADGLGPAGELVGEPALAAAAIAGEDDEPPPAGPGIGERKLEERQLVLAPDEGPGGEAPGTARRDARRGRRREREIEARILVQDRQLELLQRPARVDPELVDERTPPSLVDAERLGLPAAAVEREHQLPAQALPQRMSGDEVLELTRHLRVAAEREVGLEPLLAEVETELLEPRDLLLRESLVGHVGERRATPEGQRRRQRLGRLDGLTPGELPPRIGQEPLAAVGVELALVHLEDVAAATGLQALLRRERPPQPRDVCLQRLPGGRRRPPAVKILDQPVGGDDVPALKQQDREQGSLPRAAELERTSVVVDLERPQDPEVHCRAATGCNRPATVLQPERPIVRPVDRTGRSGREGDAR